MPRKAPVRASSQRATIQDVARLAGVSVATVSAVLNGNVVVSEVRTESVRRAIEALRYRPDERARSLRTGRSRLIGVVVPDVTNPFYPEILREIEHAASARGYSVLLCDSANEAAQERRHLEVLAARRVDGALIACTDSTESYDWLAERGFPVVFFERIPLAGRCTAVSTNHARGCSEATQHLIDNGHRDIALLLTSLSLSSVAGRVEGFRSTMAANGLPVRGELLKAGLKTAEDAAVASAELLAGPRPPTAFVCSNSVLLLGVTQSVRDAGLSCPRDVSLMCFDNPLWTRHFQPAVTTMSQPTGVIASEAVRLLLEVMEAPPPPGRQIVSLEDRLVVRQSTGPARVVGGRVRRSGSAR